MSRHTGAKLGRSAWDLDTDQDHDWRQRGACGRHPQPDWWTGDRAEEARRAALICAGCPVSAECYQYGYRTDSVGIYGGVLLRGPHKRPRKISFRLVTCVLPTCGRQFQAVNNTQRYCGTDCYQAHRAMRRRAPRPVVATSPTQDPDPMPSGPNGPCVKAVAA